MPRPAARVAAVLAVAAAVATACGKKAPLRLPEQIRPEGAPAPSASVREGAVTVRFRVPAQRLFPEREEPWVLARLLRGTGPGGDLAEAGAVLDAAGLGFGEELVLLDEGRPAAVEHVYRVEFRDARRRRRALSPALSVSWPAVPEAPRSLEALGAAGAVTLAWLPPDPAPEGLRYRVYRREQGGEPAALPGAEPTAPAFVDSRVRPGREYCYEVRGLLAGTGVEVEGPASGEGCALAGGAQPPSPPQGLAVLPVGRGYQLSWEPVDEPGVVGYAVYREIGDGPPRRVTPTPVAGTLFVDDPGDLPVGTVLRWAVTAVEGAPRGGESPMSASATATVGAR